MESIHGLGTSIWNNVYTCFPNCHWYTGKYSFGNSYHNILVYVIGFAGSIASAKELSSTIWTSAGGVVGGDDYQQVGYAPITW